jgi:tetratricopeptide (TPR) repeat protein
LSRRQADTERDVEAALRESAALAAQANKLSDDPPRWEATLRIARSAALRAESLARTGEATDELKERVEAALAELEGAERDRRLVADLEEIRLRQSDTNEKGFDRQAAVPRYTAAFAAWGLDVGQREPAVLAERLRGHAQSERLLSALRDWTRLTVDERERERLTAVLSAAEPAPDAFGRRLREALAERGTEALVRLAREADVSRLPAVTLVQLGRDLRLRGEVEAALQLLLRVQERHPSDFWLNHELASAWMQQKPSRWDEAVRYRTAAVALRPFSAAVHLNLGNALKAKGDLDGAITCYHKALELDPKLASAHHNLGLALRAKGDLEGAIACYQKALTLDPKLAQAHLGLGAILCDDKHDWDGAIVCFRQALDLDPKLALAHHNLGVALCGKGDLDGAIACYQKALKLDPKVALAHYNLGNALRDKGDRDGAIARYQKALALDPKFAPAHTNLGQALYAKGDLDGAIACSKKALKLDPKDAKAHTNLGYALAAKGNLDGAIACYHKAIEIDPKLGNAWGALGQTLLSQGRYAQARDATRRALALLPSGHPDQRLAAQQLRSCEQYLVLDGKLPAILQGEARPANASEAVALAQMCQQHKKRHASAAQLYADAFAAEWKLFPVLQQQHRYNAACSAARAAAGEGEDARLLPDKAVCMFRRWALGWLREDLTAYDKRAGQNNPAANKAIQQRLAHWRSDGDLASVRDSQALDRLPENERAAWQALWRDVEQVANRVAKKDN